MSNPSVYVRAAMAPAQPAPRSTVGVAGWLRTNLFSSLWNTVLTLLAIALIVSIVVPTVRFTLVDAVWSGEGREACLAANGACWAYVKAYLPQFIYGRYPIDERWRVDLVYAMLALGLVLLMVPRIPAKGATLAFMLLVFPVVAFVLLTGGGLELDGGLIPDDVMAPSAFRFWIEYGAVCAVLLALAAALAAWQGASVARTLRNLAAALAVLAVVLLAVSVDVGLEHVETANWGGMLVTLVVAVTGMTASMPLGVLLALGRRSNMPVVRLASVVFIEVWRGVPLITVLFMSSVMLPLFLPSGVTIDKLFRALVGVALFNSAYMAEVIRGGLQAIPRGQYEAARALGLGYWQMMRMIVLPQALRLVIPGIVGSFISLFKDTTLVLIIGLFDFLGQIQASANSATWASPVTGISGYIFAAFVYWIFCFGMSQYAGFVERRLDTGYKR
ncbi:amino acid ABC transporter permease [Prosthecomicrobium pneumaticum]|uniref:General L-amino acid transport system permease protein n=1 Tax=Prosthecomicrobium pneumaticum TaxID=81895 RepID=A0A7W9FQC8_9HYPH|nr:amino acid ABC transporter permease [Prosthecomicrobium pneumaticum]MBB5754875.1 general L-amino acid transport system permease protein [Prosthecomicrobium pneumaticum]